MQSIDCPFESTTKSTGDPYPPGYREGGGLNPYVQTRGLSQPLLRPRVATLLGVDRRWHLPLLICRALGAAPALWWGMHCFIALIAQLSLPRPVEIPDCHLDFAERQLRATELFLAILWCFAAGYLSYLFLDNLLSRWLLFYAPLATLVRLLTTDVLIAYISSQVVTFYGASENMDMLLPAWITISATLTLLYHIAHRNVNIRKETSTSISVFSFVSFLSMCLILCQLHMNLYRKPT